MEGGDAPAGATAEGESAKSDGVVEQSVGPAAASPARGVTGKDAAAGGARLWGTAESRERWLAAMQAAHQSPSSAAVSGTVRWDGDGRVQIEILGVGILTLPLVGLPTPGKKSHRHIPSTHPTDTSHRTPHCLRGSELLTAHDCLPLPCSSTCSSTCLSVPYYY